jgi:ABC-type polysaccharide/polyol phosphate export permease
MTLTRDTVFPKEVLVISSVITNTIDFFVSMAICIVLGFFSGVHVTSALAALPFVFILQILVVMWVSFLLSGFFVYVRDLSHVYQVFLRLLFFVTPIFYSLSFVGQGPAKYVVMANPLTHSIVFSRAVIIDGRLFDVKLFGALLVVNAVLVFASYKLFKKLEPSFAENV